MLEPFPGGCQMAVPIERESSSPGKPEKKAWTTPVLETIPVHAALGNKAGSKCDRFGSVSHGTGCPQ
jgi:hypothetical protein